MNPPKEDEFVRIAKRLEELVKGNAIQGKAKKGLQDCIRDLKEVIGEVWKDVVEDEELCEACRDGECEHCSEGEPQIVQICPAPAGYKAVFAETDETDPTKMMISDVIALGLMKFPDGETLPMGLMIGAADIMPCEMIRTFVGYLKPGQDPVTLGPKVKEYLEKQK